MSFKKLVLSLSLAVLTAFAGASATFAASNTTVAGAQHFLPISTSVHPAIPCCGGGSSGYVSSTSYPILFLHGFNSGSGLDCLSGLWGNPINYLKKSHPNTDGSSIGSWKGPMYTIGFYSGDTNCDYNLVNSQSSHCSGYMDYSFLGPIGSNNEAIEHIACNFAWFIYNNWSAFNYNVQIVAHSMGGLIVRDALYETAARESHFPPHLYVQDVVTFSTPHNGVTGAQAIGLGITCSGCYQSDELGQGSAFLNDLNANGDDPQGAGPAGTDWTTMGSLSDNDPVDWHSATYVSGGHQLGYNDPVSTSNPKQAGYGHGDYMNDMSDAWNAHQYYCDWCYRDWTPTYYYSTGAPHSLHNMLLALLRSDY